MLQLPPRIHRVSRTVALWMMFGRPVETTLRDVDVEVIDGEG
jgi:hypothetical protein